MRHLWLFFGTLVNVGYLVNLLGSPAYAGPQFDPPGLEQAIAVQEAHSAMLMANPGIVGTAVGLAADGKAVVKIYTETVGIGGLPKTLDGFPVLVQVTGKIFALHHACGHDGGPPGSEPFPCDPPPPDPPDEPSSDCAPTDRCPRPVPIGTSTGHPNITAGTIGARVTDVGGNVYALSNNHVYANTNSAFIGDNVLQPGTFDGGSAPDDIIGTLDDFEAIVFAASDCTGGPSDPDCNTIDAAIALSSTDNLGNATPSDGYGTPKSATSLPAINKKVRKYGRTTRLTKGQITGINGTVDVCYDFVDPCPSSSLARFVGQIVVEGRGRSPFSQGGDSGSLIISDEKNDRRNPVGLVFAGSSFMGIDFTIANPINQVLTEFGVSIDGQ